jgi:hypothetical protein
MPNPEGRWTMNAAAVERLTLWVDAVGAYRVVLADAVVLGQPVPEDRAGGARRAPDLAILGDLAARHARIHRDAESYLIEAIHPVAVDDRPVQKITTLKDGATITLGRNVRLLFRRPHPLSATARLEVVSRHRLEPRADAVLLMADSCVLGPKPTSHVVARDWTGEVVLSRRAGQLFVRAPGTWKLDGTDRQGRNPITTHSQIAGETFSMSLEPG